MSTCKLGVNNLVIEYVDNTSGYIGLGGLTNPLSTLDIGGSLIVRSNLTVMSNTNLFNTCYFSNTTGNPFIFSSNNFIGINDLTPNYALDVNGAVNALGYCNLLINSFTSASISNAPTNLALSNVYGIAFYASNTVASIGPFASNTAIFASNTAVFASNLAVTSSNALYPQGLYSSNTAFFASNQVISLSNYAYPGIVFSSNTAVYSSNLAVTVSNYSYGIWKITPTGSIYAQSNVTIGAGYSNGTENLNILSNMSFSNFGKAVISASNGYFGLTNAAPKCLLDVSSGNILSQNVIKLSKSLDTSNAISITVNWSTAYATANQYFITLESTQTITNQTSFGIKRMYHTIGLSNFTKVYESLGDVFGSPLAYTTMLTNVTASNNKSVTLTSTTNYVTSGIMCHTFALEAVSYPQTTIGTVWLT